MQNGVSTVAPRPAKRYARQAGQFGVAEDAFEVIDLLLEMASDGQFLGDCGITFGGEQ